MVLTNFVECWANDSSSERSIIFGDHLLEHRSERVNLFNPTSMQLCNNNNNNNNNNYIVEESPKIVSHFSSNGYYGFAQICNVDAATNASGGNDVTGNTATQNDQVMDIEQPAHRPPVLINPVGLKYSNLIGRRKRYYDGQEVIQNAKRFCCDINNKADQQNHYDSTEESYTLDTYQQNKTKMDHDDFSAISENNINRHCNHQQSVNNSSISVPLTAKVPETPQSNSYNNNNNHNNNIYSDISRCMSSHMI